MRPRRLLLTALLPILLASLPAPSVSATPAASLVFATYNVCKSTCDAPAPAWDARRGPVGATILSAAADVVGVNEATNWQVAQRQVTTASGRTRMQRVTQWEDLQELLAPSGYSAPVQAGESCDRGLSCTHTARLLFNSKTVSQLDFGALPSAGDATLSAIAPSSSPLSASRQVAWAYLTSPSTGPFLAVSAHLTNDKSGVGEADRLAFAAGLDAWVAALNAPRGLDAALPVVLLADLNSFAARQPRGVQAALTKSGWQDAWDAPSRAGVAFNTVNYSPTARSGWPAKPLRNPSGVASRIDYILYRGPGVRATRYQVLLLLDSRGRFLPQFRGSDHNLVRATLSFPPR